MGDLSGKIICYRPMGVSVVNYIVCQETLLPEINYFQVHDFIGDLSDHCMISCNLTASATPRQPLENDCIKHTLNKYKWSKKIQEQFELQLESPDFIGQVNEFLNGKNTGIDVDTMTATVNNLMYYLANRTTSMNKKHRKNPCKRKTIPQKKWFDDECTSLKQRIKYLSKLMTIDTPMTHILGVISINVKNCIKPY